MGLFFYPRGGSAQVAGSLTRALVAHGWHVTLACGSLGAEGALGNAATVFGGLDIVPAAYDDAVARWHLGEDPMDAPFPMHPSYEARAGVPDRVFSTVSPLQSRGMVSAWSRLLSRSTGLADAQLLHLHHLTPLHEAAAAVFPDVPVITHLHGTELKMLDAIEQAPRSAGGGWWAAQMRRSAQAASATIALSPFEQGEAVRLLGLDPETVHCLPNGVDVERFAEGRPDDAARLSHWLRWLAHDPRGWDEASGLPGSVAYTERQVLDAFVDPATGGSLPVLLFVGRFLHFKRVPLLIRAYARARERMAVPAPLVLWGGVPGEWQGEHPHSVVQREGVDGVFLAGWRGHDELPLGLACADCFVAPSTDEPFGLVFLEAMSSGLPVIGTASGGPPSFVNVVPCEPDGWLVPPDDEAALAEVLVAAVDSGAERARRGANARRHARERYSWDRAAGRLAALYRTQLVGGGPG